MILPNWILFDQESRKFSITPLPSHFGHTYNIEVIARNSKLETSDRFFFKVGMSFEYALTIILGIIGAIGSFLGIYTYRKLIFSFFGKRFYCYSAFDRIMVGQNYKKNLYLIKEDLELCQIVWKIILNSQKDISKIFYSPDKEEILTTLIKKATYEFKIKSKLIEFIQLHNGRYRDIFESYLIFETIKKQHPKVNWFFKKIKQSLQKNTLKSWYYDLVDFSNLDVNEDEKCKSFAKIKINIFKLQTIISKINKNNKESSKIYNEIPEIEKTLIIGKLKAYVLGIPAPFSKFDRFMEDSRGESIWVNQSDIAEIQIHKLDLKKKNINLHSNIFNFPRQYHYNCLTSWLKYTVERDDLVFFGRPSDSDIGKYVVRIFNRHSYILREFGLTVVELDNEIPTNSERKFKTLRTGQDSPDHVKELGSMLKSESNFFIKRVEPEIQNSDFGKQKKSNIEVEEEK